MCHKDNWETNLEKSVDSPFFFRENVEEYVCVPIGFSACTVEFDEHDGLVDKIA